MDEARRSEPSIHAVDECKFTQNGIPSNNKRTIPQNATRVDRVWLELFVVIVTNEANVIIYAASGPTHVRTWFQQLVSTLKSHQVLLIWQRKVAAGRTTSDLQWVRGPSDNLPNSWEERNVQAGLYDAWRLESLTSSTNPMLWSAVICAESLQLPWISHHVAPC